MASKARVLYSFDGEASNGELTINEGETLTVLNPNVGDGWWEGSNSKGEKGLFPASYVQAISVSSNPAPPPRPPPGVNTGYSAGGGADDDSWDDDDWDDDDDYTTSQTSEAGSQQNGQVRRRINSGGGGGGSAGRGGGHVNRNMTIKKSLNRFSVFVKSGGESFLLGATTADNRNINATDVALIVETTSGVGWDKIRQPFTCIVTQPEKKSKFKGMKSFIAYNITSTATGTSVSRRYKHFDWLYCRLLEKFTCLSVPPLPEKQITGKYDEDFVEKRRERLQIWLNRLTRHPVVCQSEVFQHFLNCKDNNEKEWKAGKRKAENDKLSGAAFFLTVKTPYTTMDLDDADVKIEEFATFYKTMDESVHRLNERCRSYALKNEGVIATSQKKFGAPLLNLSSAFSLSNYGQSLTAAIQHTGQTYDEIGCMFAEQPRKDMQYLMEGLHEYTGLLSTFPEIIHVHKSTVEKVKECERKQTEEKVEPDLVEQVTHRANVITNVTFAEINHFHEQRVDDFKLLMQRFLKEQINFYQGIVDKLQGSLKMYENV